jgi:hypothetical protein
MAQIPSLQALCLILQLCPRGNHLNVFDVKPVSAQPGKVLDGQMAGLRR